MIHVPSLFIMLGVWTLVGIYIYITLRFTRSSEEGVPETIAVAKRKAAAKCERRPEGLVSIGDPLRI